MDYGNMRSRNRHIKNIKIYHYEFDSFLKLKNKDFFNLLDLADNEYKELLLELLIYTVYDINHKDEFSCEEFSDILSDFFTITELHHDKEFPDFMTNQITTQLYDIYKNKTFPDYKGRVLELLMVYLEKTNNNKIYHEPRFYYKRKRLFKNEFKGSNCLIDVVVQENRTCTLSLIECKANLDNRIKRLNRSGDKFNRKLEFMDKLENKISKYVNHDNEKVKVNKILASIKVPSRILPSTYVNYKYINLYDHFMLKKEVS